MRLLRIEVDKATDLQLAHSQLGARGRVAKATVLKESHIASLVDAGVATVDVVVPDPNEIAEDLVSERLIHSLTWAGCVFKKPTVVDTMFMPHIQVSWTLSGLILMRLMPCRRK